MAHLECSLKPVVGMCQSQVIRMEGGGGRLWGKETGLLSWVLEIKYNGSDNNPMMCLFSTTSHVVLTEKQINVIFQRGSRVQGHTANRQSGCIAIDSPT